MFLLSLPVSVYAGLCPDGPTDQCNISIELNKSVIKRTIRPVTRIAIANPEIVDYHLITPTQILLFAKGKLGSTNLIVWYDEDTTEVFEIRVFISGDILKTIQGAIEEIVPDARIRLKEGRSGLMVFGEVDSQEMLDAVLKVVSSYVSSYTNLVTVRGSQQVQLSVRIAEVSRTGIKQMGLGFLTNRDWAIGVFPSGGMTGTSKASTKNISTGIPARTTTYTRDPDTGRIVSASTDFQNVRQDFETVTRELASTAVLSSPYASAFQIAVHSLNNDFMGILNLLKGQNLARIIASPTLVTMSGQEASFLAGGEFPIPVQGQDNQTTIQYKSYGIMLRFTPTVVGRETITIQVEPEISSLDYSTSVVSGGVGVPGVKTRRGSTTLQLKDGQTFVMAGLLREDFFTTTSKVPLLGDIPYLGTLFTSKEVKKNESELMIIVTPHLVRALNPDEVPKLPGEDGMGMVSDYEFFMKNRTEPDQDRHSLTLHDEGSHDRLVGGSGFAR